MLLVVVPIPSIYIPVCMYVYICTDVKISVRSFERREAKEIKLGIRMYM